MAVTNILVMIGDDFLQDLSPDVVLHHVRVTQELNEHWWCRIECRQTEDRRPPYEDWLGKKLSVFATGDSGLHPRKQRGSRHSDRGPRAAASDPDAAWRCPGGGPGAPLAHALR